MKAQRIRQIAAALQNQNISEALQLANQLVVDYPNDAEAIATLGDVFAEMDNWTKAIENYDRALAISPNSAEIYFKLGLAYEGKDDFQSARQQFQTARKLDPANKRYAGHFGKLLHEKGRQTQNINFEVEGYQLMEQALDHDTDYAVREQLAIAIIENAFNAWRQDPEHPEKRLITERGQIEHTRSAIERACNLIGNSNLSVNNRVAELDSYMSEMEKRKFAGYNYLLKAPAIAGGLMLLFGLKTPGVLLLVMAAAYYASQMKPGYLANRIYFKGDYRDPFIVRRLDALSQEMGGITIWSTSMSDLMWQRFLFRTVFGALRYAMVIVMLPYEIIKGFIVNFDLMKRVQTRIAAW